MFHRLKIQALEEEAGRLRRGEGLNTRQKIVRFLFGQLIFGFVFHRLLVCLFILGNMQ